MITYRTEHVLVEVDEQQNITFLSFQRIATSDDGVEVEGIWEFPFTPAREGHIDLIVTEIIDAIPIDDALASALNEKIRQLSRTSNSSSPFGNSVRKVSTRFGVRPPILLVITGQSNAVGVNRGGSDPYNSLVKTWTPSTESWTVGGQYTAMPWTESTPDGNGGNNNFGLSAAHYIAEKTGKDVYIVFDAVGGKSITEWVPATQPRYVSLKEKIEAALASDEMLAASKKNIDLLIWVQGEENGAGENAMDFNTYTSYLKNLDRQWRGDYADLVNYPGETWMNDFTPIFTMGLSPLHDRYQIGTALQVFAKKGNGRWRYLSTRGLQTEYQRSGTGDYTHWLGDSLWEGGYKIIGPAFVNDDVAGQESESALFWDRGNGSANAGSKTVISSFDSLVSWESRNSGMMLQETFSGNNSNQSFVLNYRGTTIVSVTVNGIEVDESSGYVLSIAPDGRKTITFLVAPESGSNNIVVEYGSAINAVGTSNSFAWGYACYPDGNFTFTGGYVVASHNTCNYSISYGRELYLGAAADYSALFGYQNVLDAPYSFSAGRGHYVSDDSGTAIGKYSEYIAAQKDAVLFQVGNGTLVTRSNALTVRSSGILEAKHLPTFSTNTDALSGGLRVGQIYKTAGGELRIVV